MRRADFLRGVGLGVAGLVAGHQAAAQGRSLAIGYQDKPDWLLYVARDHGLFEKAGLSPTFVKFDASPPMIEAFKNGSLDLACVGSVAFLIGLSQGLDWTMIGINPEGAYGQGPSGQAVFTHGMQFGMARTRSRNLEDATQQLLQSLAQGNQSLQQASGPQRARFGNREGIEVQLRNRSDATGGPEIVSVYTTLLPDDTLLYGIGVAPQDEWRQYGPVFDHVVGTARVP